MQEDDKKILGHSVNHAVDNDIERIKFVIIHLQNWEALRNKKEGQFLLKYYEEMIELIRGEYSNIDMDNPDIKADLSAIRAKEGLVREFIHVLSAPKETSKKVLDGRLKELVQLKKLQEQTPITGGIVSRNVKGKS